MEGRKQGPAEPQSAYQAGRFSGHEVRLGERYPRHAATESRRTYRRDRVRARPRLADGQSRLPASPEPHPWYRALAFQDVALLRAEVEERSPRSDAAGSLDSLVLLGRGDSASGRTSPVRVLPSGRLRSLRPSLAARARACAKATGR